MSKFKIGIDIQSTAGPKTGIGQYTASIIEQFKTLDGFEFCYYQVSRQDDLNTLERLKWENFSIPRLAKKDRIDILHIPGFAGPALRGEYKKVTTVHDLIGMRFPQNLNAISRFYWQRWLPFCVKNSNLIIADSENTKKDIIELLKIEAGKIRVVYLAADSKFRPLEKTDVNRVVLKKYGIDRKYILNVGTIEPRKNITGLIEAFAKYLRESGRDDLLLVIAGKKGWDYLRCRRKAEETGFENRIIFCDYVDDSELPILYNFSEAFVYPSFYEGFGLPVLEALNCGAAVICSDVSSLPEIAEKAAFFIDPYNIDSIKSALQVVLKDSSLRGDISRRSLEQSKRFSWKKTAEELIDIYKEILN